MENTVLTIASHLENIGTVLTAAIGWVGSCGEMIASSPLLYVPCILGVGMFGVNVIKRFV